MGATLQALLELQAIELQIVDIRKQLARREKAHAAQVSKLENWRATLEAERQHIMRAQADVDALDLDLKARASSIAKLRDQLNSVRTNKEYAAVLAQMNTEKADASKQEARALEMMGLVETRRRELAEREKSGEGESAKLADLKAQWEQAQRTFADRLGKLSAERAVAAAKLDKEVLGAFDRIAERYDGEVMARVGRTSPRRDEFICEGCNLQINAERANALLTRDEVHMCRNCGRILFMEKGT